MSGKKLAIMRCSDVPALAHFFRISPASDGLRPAERAATDTNDRRLAGLLKRHVFDDIRIVLATSAVARKVRSDAPLERGQRVLDLTSAVISRRTIPSSNADAHRDRRL